MGIEYAFTVRAGTESKVDSYFATIADVVTDSKVVFSSQRDGEIVSVSIVNSGVLSSGTTDVEIFIDGITTGIKYPIVSTVTDETVWKWSGPEYIEIP